MALDDVGIHISCVVQIPLRFRARCVPAEHGTCQHCRFLNVRDVAPRIMAAGDVTVFLAVTGIPFGGIVATLAFFDDNKLSCGGQNGKAGIG